MPRVDRSLALGPGTNGFCVWAIIIIFLFAFAQVGLRSRKRKNVLLTSFSMIKHKRKSAHFCAITIVRIPALAVQHALAKAWSG